MAPAVADVHEPMGPAGPKRSQIAGEHDSTMIDDDHVLAQVLDQVELMAGEQHGCTCGGDLGEEAARLAMAIGIEPRERLIEDEQIRVR